MNEFSLAGRQALVTGSTQGIGRAIAASLENAGAEVLYHGLRVLEDTPVGALTCDLTEAGATEALIDEAFQRAPGLDILVCNAGSFFDVPYFEVTPAVFEKTYALNVRANYFLVQAFAKRLQSLGRGGAIVILSSTNGLQAEFDSTVYDSSKGALIMMTRTLALNLARHGIRVNCIAPGLVRTAFTENWIDAQTELRAHYQKNIPLGRIGQPQDCGGAAVFLVSGAAAYVTGQVLAVDGGLTVAQIGPL